MPVQPRSTQAERRARSRNAILEAAARGLAKYGYAELSLARVAEAAGYTRGAVYHQFAGKEDLALAVVDWVHLTWQQEVGHLLTAARAGIEPESAERTGSADPAEPSDPTETLLTVARRHAIYCRREVAAVLLNLRVEFNHRDHPVGRAIADLVAALNDDCTALIESGRSSGAIPPGPPAPAVATAYLGALEAITINLAGRQPYDVELAERAARGILGLPPAP